jgi:hypothetical protein
MRTCGYIGHLKRMVAMEVSGDVFQFSLFGRIGVRLILGNWYGIMKCNFI